MKIDKERKRIAVYLNSDQVSMAIGRGGQNIKLAGKLVGYEIDVFRDVPKDEMDDEDVELQEFADDIDSWILEELHKIGLDTAKQVLALSKEELERRTELEEETIEEILDILRSEFE
jgi:transcription termination/antitermination protein NusA